MEKYLRRGNAKGLVVFDLDGTLLRGPTVCELLAAPLGKSKEMKRLEMSSTKREVKKARAEMARWYKGVPRKRLLRSLDALTWAPGARAAVQDLKNAGLEVAIASITWQFAVEEIAKRLAIAHFLGTYLQDDGRIVHTWAKDKASWLLRLMSSLSLPPERTAAVGDSTNDMPMLAIANLRFYVGSDVPQRIACIHMPSADLTQIAEEIIARWNT